MRKLYLTLAAIIVAALATLAVTLTAASASNAPPKVIVCKYVGPPGNNEVLQTGQNPIAVSENALEGDGFAGVFPFEFSDAQGHSVAVRYATGPTDNGDAVTDCGVAPPPEVTTVEPVNPDVIQPTCDRPQGTVTPVATDGLTYVVTTTADGAIVTATADEGFTIGADAPAGWIVADDGLSATLTVTLTPATDCGGGGTKPPGTPPTKHDSHHDANGVPTDAIGVVQDVNAGAEIGGG